MNKYLICGIDKNAGCLVRAFDTPEEMFKAVNMMIRYIDLVSVSCYYNHKEIYKHVERR